MDIVCRDEHDRMVQDLKNMQKDTKDNLSKVKAEVEFTITSQLPTKVRNYLYRSFVH